MSLFISSNRNEELKRGDRVKVRYMGIEGIIISVDTYTCMVTYLNEFDQETVETFNKDKIEKC